MKDFLKGRLFLLIASTLIAAGLFFLTPECLSAKWKIIIIGILFAITNLAGPMTDLGKRISFVGLVNKIWTLLNRVFVGGLFIFSGTIKSNDPTGFSYKLKEYFEIFAADVEGTWLSFLKGLFEYFHHHSVGVAIVICVVEVAFGFMLLIGFKRMFTLWILLAQIVFFTFLTFYSACYNKVTHCGCFGDFIKFAPWESFTKDIILLVAIAFLFAGKNHITPLFKRNLFNCIATAAAIAISTWFPWYCYNNLPVWDFLPFKEGANICEGRKPGPNYKPAKYVSFYFYKNLKTGKEQLFHQDSLPWQDTVNWAYARLDGDPKMVSPEIDPAKISGFTVKNEDGIEIGDTLLASGKPFFLMICWDLKLMEKDPALIAKINEFSGQCEKENIPFYAVTNNLWDDIKKFKFDHQALFDFATCADDVQLKMMVRANPGLMYFNGCTMVKKWHHNNFPTLSEVKTKYMK